MITRQPVVHVVDDDASFRNAVTRLLRAGGYDVKCYSSASEFSSARTGEMPGCILLDLHMPGPSGLQLQETLCHVDNSLPIIFLTGQGDIPSSVHAIKRGAEDFLTKPVNKEKLFSAIERALARDARDRVRRSHLRELRARYETLTPREREVLSSVIAGKLNKQIADDLGTVERTVKAHRAKVMEKMQVTSITDLVRAASALGLN